MRKLAEVDEARAIMTEAVNWSVMKWLSEKKRVRKSADKANAALDVVEKETKAVWPDELKAAYNALLPSSPEAEARRAPGAVKANAAGVDAQVKALAAKVKEADDQAWLAHLEAEDIFDRAERRLSTSMAREGCGKAILSWDLHEAAIKKAESGIRSGAAK